MSAGESINVALHPVLVEPFKEWLASRGQGLAGPFATSDAGEPFYVVTPAQDPDEPWCPNAGCDGTNHIGGYCMTVAGFPGKGEAGG